MAEAEAHERIANLKRRKAGHVGEITKITETLDVFLRDKRNWQEVQVYRKRLAEQWRRYLQVYDELIQLIPRESDDFAKEKENHNKRIQVYQLYTADIEQYLDREDKETYAGSDIRCLVEDEGSKAVDMVMKSPRIPDETKSDSSKSSKRSSSSSRSREGARLEKVLAERKLELLKNAKERKLNEQRLKLENEIAEAEDEADLARTKEQILEQFEEILLDDLGVESKVDRPLPFMSTDVKVPGVVRQVKTSAEIRSQVPRRNGFPTSPPEPISPRDPIARKPFINNIYGRSAERFPSTPVRPRSFPLYHSDLTPSPLSEVDHAILFPPLNVKGNCEGLEPRVDLRAEHHPQGPTDDPGRILTMLTTSMNSIVTRANLPPLEIVKFSGDPCNYYKFKSRFNDMVLTQDLTEFQKMSRLLQFLDGEARIAVAGFEGIKGGLHKAMRLLENRYGQPHIVTKACVDAMVDGPTISNNDRAGLREFADKARTLYETLSSINALGEMNMTNLAQMSRKLPVTHQIKWREDVQRIREKERNPNLLDLVEFIERRSSIVNDPVFGRVGETSKPPTFSRKDGNKVKKDKEKISALAAQLRIDRCTQYEVVEETKCVVCEGSHKLNDCPVFKTRTIRQRNIIVRANKLCLNCLNEGHFAFHCKSRLRCLTCRRKHHSLLHKEVDADQRPPGLKSGEKSNNITDMDSSNTKQEEKATTSKDTVNVSVATSHDGHKRSPMSRIKTAIQVVPVRIRGESGETVETYALLDTGSEESFVERTLVDKLNLKETSFEVLTVCTLTGESTVDVGRTDLTVEPLENPEGRRVQIKDIKIVENLNIKPFKPEDLSRWPHLADINLPRIDEEKVTILIGANIPEVQVHEESRTGRVGEPYAVRTMLGWAILGPVGSRRNNGRGRANVHFTRYGDEHLDQQLKQLLDLDNIARGNLGSKAMSQDDRQAQQILDRTVRLVNGRYEVGMLWKSDETWLPDNRRFAVAQLRSLKRKLDKNVELRGKYKDSLNDYLEKGYARKVTVEEAARRTNKTWYLPHHGVFHPRKPGKLRVVFNAAALHEGVSLNNQLYHGPDLANSLVGVLLRFRQERIAIVADINAMFHQVKVPPKDSDSLRYLWGENENLEGEPEEYQMTSHIFGATDSPCCANYCLKKTAEDNKAHFSEKAINTVKKDFYVDDLLKALPSEMEAINLANELIELLRRGGFRLAKWMSNSRKVLANISEKERTNPSLDLDLDHLPVERALGIQWDVEHDVFKFQVNNLDKPNTKRGVLSTFSSLYDPLGLVCPIVLEAKKIMQRLWKAQVDWDEPISALESARWERWKAELAQLTLLEIPRCYLSSTTAVAEITLHLFSDASEGGYGMCSYLRFLHVDGTVHCAFLIGKSRTSPLKPISIPRLELQAATLSVKVYKVIREELTYSVAQTFFWTDSQTTLQYIRNRTKRFNAFVANRVTEINEETIVEQWRYCPGKVNPADDASRGLSPLKLCSKSRWWNGPEFLWRKRENWPTIEVPAIGDDNPEVLTKIRTHAVNTATIHHSLLSNMIKYHSSWVKLQRHLAWIIRFINWIRSKKTSCDRGVLTLAELDHASKIVIKCVQSEAFAEDINHLKTNKEVQRSSNLVKLKPLLSDDILRVGGRLEQAPTLSYEEKHPPILPKNHHLSFLILQHCHQSSAHAGREQTLAQSRQKFWIIQGRNLAKKVIRNCFKCLRLNSRPMTQVMAPLPEVRLKPYNPPFTNAGVDFFGPLMVRRGRGVAKRWGCLITCLNTRAVFLEVAPSLQTDDFILLLRQFISRRGPPIEIRSDRGTNFVGADRELRDALKKLDHRKIEQEMMKKQIKWVFHPPAAPHMSGVWERLVQTAKKHLKMVIGDRLLNEFALRTLFAEVEFIMNNRPLVAASEDPEDLEALTPNHFLLQRRVLGQPPGTFVKEDYLGRKQWRKVQYLTDLFWKRWIKEYLPKLQERQKWFKTRRNIQIDDLVLMKEAGLTRNKWPLARVIEVFPGRDRRIRSAKIKTANGEFHRPISQICLLEGDSKGFSN